ncbi:DDE-type integrase/transposase/recombinase, partial [Aduncisulcus paluster]
DTWESYDNVKELEALDKYLEAVKDSDDALKSLTEDEFLDNLSAVLGRARKFSLRVKASKCVIGKREVTYLGRVINETGIKIAPACFEALDKLRAPKTRKEVKQLMGFLNFYAKTIKDFQTTVEPIQRLTNKQIKWEWSETQQNAFDEIIARMKENPSLHHIDYNLPLTLRTDASDTGAGGVLFQTRGGNEEPVMYFSHVFRRNQTAWSTHDKEAYAIVYCLQKAESLLQGVRFDIQTDHRNLLWMNKSSTARVIRWTTYLNQFDFEIEHIKGKDNVVADTLSRMISETRRVIADEQTIHELIKESQATTPPTSEEYEREGELWVRSDTGQIYLPDNEDLHTKLIKHFHSSISGHHWIRSTIDKLKDFGLSWPTMYLDVRQVIKGCLTCQKITESKLSRKTPTLSISHAEAGHTWFIDSLGPLPRTADGYEYVIAATDAFTRYTELFPVTSLTAKEAAFHIISLIGRHGIPHTIHTDQGTQYANYLADHLYDTLGIKHHRVTSHHPTGNGMIERTNREIKRHLRALILELAEQCDWPLMLPIVASILNNHKHSVTGITPHELTYGKFKNETLVQDWTTPRKTSEEEMPKGREAEIEYVRNLTDNILKLREYAKTRQRRKEMKDIGEDEDKAIKVMGKGDKVFVKNYTEGTKLKSALFGPYEVIERVGAKTYTIKNELEPDGIQTVHDEDIVPAEINNTTEPDSIKALRASDKGRRVIQTISAHKGRKGQRQFRVHWAGLPEAKDSWEHEKNIKESIILDIYKKNNGL